MRNAACRCARNKDREHRTQTQRRQNYVEKSKTGALSFTWTHGKEWGYRFGLRCKE